MIVGSLIKNPGGGLAPIGGYIAGRADLIENCAYRLTSPGLGKEVGATLGVTQSFYQGFFLAPTVVCGALKGATFAANQGNMKQFYYGNNAKGDNGYAIYAQRSNTGAIEQIKANFLPNYIPSIGMHGVPYVKGPFITREPDRAVSTNNEITGNQVDNGIYKLRWV